MPLRLRGRLRRVLQLARRTFSPPPIVPALHSHKLVLTQPSSSSSSPSTPSSSSPITPPSWLPSTVRFSLPISVVPIPGKGRGAIARQRINKGSTVLIEEPACSLLLSSLPLPLPPTPRAHCSYCLAPLDDERSANPHPLPPPTHCSGCGAAYCSAEHQRLHALASHSITCGHIPPSSHPPPLTQDTTPPPLPLKFPLMAADLLATTLIQTLTPSLSPSPSSPLPLLWMDLGPLCHAELDPLTFTPDYAALLSHLHSHLHLHPSLTSTHLTPSQLSALLPPSLHLRALALLHLNCHSVHPTPLPLPSPPFATALFPYAATFNHHCHPNLALTYPLQTSGAGGTGGGKRVGVWTALRDVEEGEELCNTYTDLGAPVEQRRAYLEWAYGFRCECERCVQEAGSE